MFFMCLSGSFSHSDFFATGQQMALKNKHFFFKEDIHDYRMISGTTVEALDKIYLCHLPRAYSTGIWSHPSPLLDPQPSPPLPNPAPGAAFHMGADARMGFWAAASPVWSHRPWGAHPLLGHWVPGPATQVLGVYFIPHNVAPKCIYILFSSVQSCG